MKKLIAIATLAGSLLIASPTFAYEVKSGDTMSEIAMNHGMTLQELAEMNPQVKDINLIYVGDTIHTEKAAANAGTDESEQSTLVYEEHTKQVQGDWEQGEATAYYPANTSMQGGYFTATGYDLRQGVTYKGYRVLAMDKSIPMYSIVEVKLSNGSTFKGIKLDVGGAIIGDKIDIAMISRNEAYNFGRQSIQYRIIGKL